MPQLHNRTALITGASSGLGAHFARLFAREGARVVLGARRTDRIAALATELEATGKPALAVALDVTDEASVKQAYDAAEARFGTVDTIVANAGVAAAARATDLAAESLRQLTDTNINGVYLTVREGAKRLIADGSQKHARGRVIILGSISAHITFPGEAAYAASKAAVAHLGRNFAREWVRQGVNVNTVQPGYILTEISDDWFASEAGKAQIAGFHRRRLQPIDSLDPLMLYLASDASASMTGSVIDLDDGQSL